MATSKRAAGRAGWLCPRCGSENRASDQACAVCLARPSAPYRALDRLQAQTERLRLRSEERQGLRAQRRAARRARESALLAWLGAHSRQLSGGVKLFARACAILALAAALSSAVPAVLDSQGSGFPRAAAQAAKLGESAHGTDLQGLWAGRRVFTEPGAFHGKAARAVDAWRDSAGLVKKALQEEPGALGSAFEGNLWRLRDWFFNSFGR